MPALSHTDYTVGWVSAVPIEMAAAEAMLDEIHPDLPSSEGDSNAYILGRIGYHNIVIACLPSGEYGISSATSVATRLMSTFTAIRFGLMVGIGGGIWRDTADIRLGDVVVGHPAKTHGGVIQYDFGKALTGRHFERIGMLNRPPQILLTAISKLRAHHQANRSRVPEFISAATASVFARPQGEDRLFESRYNHIPDNKTCERCDTSKIVQRPVRENQDPAIHYGLILSGNQVIKDSGIRDELTAEEGYCVEMEAAGLMNTFPCIVIRGICDYADSHKNKEWQGYAAASAAAFTKELLLIVPANNFRPNEAPELDKTVLDAIERLPRAEKAAYNSSLGETKPFCLPNTRVKVLRTISEWSQSDESPCMFWLSGMAGTGKSTIARTVADTFSKQGCIAVSFFFSRGGGDIASPAKFVTTLAAQLANRQPFLKRYIGEAIKSNPEVISEGLASQWRQLIVEPLKRLEEKPLNFRPFNITIDALDQCEGGENVTRILQQLSQLSQIRKLKIRIFVTSRPERRILVDFSRMVNSIRRRLRLHDIESSITESDIRIYLSHTLGDIARYRSAPSGWPSENEIFRLAAQASGLFIYAATACRFIEKRHKPPADSLALFLDKSHGKPANSAHKSLDSLYVQIIEKSLFGSLGEDDDDIREEATESFIGLLGPLVLLFDLLPISAYSKLVGILETNMASFLTEFSAVLDIPEDTEAPIQLLHPSFRDFLTNSNRCPAEYLINGPEIHKLLAECCIRVMERGLKSDICGRSHPGAYTADVSTAIVEAHIPSELRYACNYWIRHIIMSSIDFSDNGRLHGFLKMHLLHWLEAQSWMGAVTNALQALITLKGQVEVVAGTKNELYQFLEESRRFILANRYITDNMPLQLYLSSIIFAPRDSIIRRTFKTSVPCWVTRFPHGPSSWGPKTLVDSEAVESLIFRPNGELIAGYSNGLIRVWDIDSQSVLRTWATQKSAIVSLQLADEGLWSVSRDVIITQWDIDSGQRVNTFSKPEAALSLFILRPDGSIIWESSGTIHVEYPATRGKSQQIQACKDRIVALAISPNGIVASCSLRSQVIRLWDLQKGTLIKTLKSNLRSIHDLDFSADGVTLGSLEVTGKFELFNLETGHILRKSLGMNRHPLSLKITHKFVEFTGSWEPVLFSPRAIFIVSSIGERAFPLISNVCCCDTSPDGKILAAGLKNGVVQLHDLNKNTHEYQIRNHYGIKILVSPLLDRAVIKEEKKIIIWNTLEWKSVLSVDADLTSSWDWAPSTQRVVIFSLTQYTMADMNTGRVLSRFGSETFEVLTWALSPDAEVLAEIGRSTLNIYHLMAGAIIHSIELDQAFPEAGLKPEYQVDLREHGPLPVFSADGSFVAIKFNKRNSCARLLLCNTVSGELILISPHIPAPSLWPSIHAIFSPDSKCLATMIENKYLQVFNTSTGALIYSREIPGSFQVSDLRFSAEEQAVSFCWDLNQERVECDIASNTLRVLEADKTRHSHQVGSFPELYRLLHLKGDATAPESLAWRIAIDKNWVTLDGENILWLPPHYFGPGTQWDATEKDIIFGALNGELERIGFDFSLFPAIGYAGAPPRSRNIYSKL